MSTGGLTPENALAVQNALSEYCDVIDRPDATADEFAALFAPDATLELTTRGKTVRGADELRQLWTDIRVRWPRRRPAAAFSSRAHRSALVKFLSFFFFFFCFSFLFSFFCRIWVSPLRTSTAGRQALVGSGALHIESNVLLGHSGSWFTNRSYWQCVRRGRVVADVDVLRPSHPAAQVQSSGRIVVHLEVYPKGSVKWARGTPRRRARRNASRRRCCGVRGRIWRGTGGVRGCLGQVGPARAPVLVPQR